METRYSGFICLVLAGTLLVSGSPAIAGDFGMSAQGQFTFRGGDDEAYRLNDMNRGDNPFSPFRMLLITRAQINPNTNLFLEVPIDPSASSSMFLTYLRPFVRVSSLGGYKWMNLQAGKLPTVFGTFSERVTSTETGPMGIPLLYYYHTSVRGDLILENADYFFQPGIRGYGIESVSQGGVFSLVGSPLIYDACWDTGAEMFGSHQGVQYSFAGTHGTVSRPATSAENYNDGYQLVGRLGYQVQEGPLFGLRMGVSGAMGPYLSGSVGQSQYFPLDSSPEDYLNTAIGADLSFARGPWQFYGEAGQIGFEVPNVDPTLKTTSYYLELNRDFGPAWSVAVRQEGVFFNDITSTFGLTEGWDYDLTRWETAINFRFREGTRLRFGYQTTRFPDAEALNSDLFAVQLQVWTR